MTPLIQPADVGGRRALGLGAKVEEGGDLSLFADPEILGAPVTVQIGKMNGRYVGNRHRCAGWSNSLLLIDDVAVILPGVAQAGRWLSCSIPWARDI